MNVIDFQAYKIKKNKQLSRNKIGELALISKIGAVREIKKCLLRCIDNS